MAPFLQLFSLTAVRILAALASLISVIVIVRVFPIAEAGKFFVFLASTQFVAGAALGPLSVLAIRFGSIHYTDADHSALGRLLLLGFGAILLLSAFTLIIHKNLSLITDLVVGKSWVFAASVGLGGALAFLTGIARVNGRVVMAIIPENVLKPACLAALASFLWLSGAATFNTLSIAYLMVLLVVVATLLAMTPWRAARFSLGTYAAYRPYLRAYGPLLLFGMVSTALTTFDVFLVSSVVSVDAVPAYRAALQYAMLLTTGVLFSNLLYGPKIAIAYRDGDIDALQAHARSSSRLALIFFFIAFTPLLTGPWFFTLFFGEIGAEAWSLALVLCAGRFLNAWFGSVTNIANLSGRTLLLSLLQGVGVLILVILGSALGAQFGSIGVAIASAIALSAWVAATTFFLQRSLVLRMGPL